MKVSTIILGICFKNRFCAIGIIGNKDALPILGFNYYGLKFAMEKVSRLFVANL